MIICSRAKHRGYLAIIAGIVALIVMIGVWLQAPPDIASLSFGLAVWSGLYTTARLLSIRLASTQFSFSHILIIAMFLSLGLPFALLIALLGTLTEKVARMVFRLRFGSYRQKVRKTIYVLSLDLATTILSLSLSSVVFYSIGGRAPLSKLDLTIAIALVALFVAYSSLNVLLSLALSRNKPHTSLSYWLPRNLQSFVLYKFLPLPLALVVSAFYNDLSFTLFMLFALFLIAIMLLLYAVNRANTKLEKRVREIASVSAVGQAIVNSLDLPELLEAIHQHISPLMDARNFYVALYQEDYNELSFPLAYEDGRTVRYRNRHVSNGLTEYVLRTRESLLIQSDLQATVERLGLDVVERLARCWLGVPITTGDRVLGIMAVQSHKRVNAYDSNDVELLNTIANQMAVAIEKAQLYASTRRRAAELAILNSVSSAVGSSLDLDQVMDAIVTSVGPVMGCQMVAIFLVQESGMGLELAAARGLSESFLQQAPEMTRMTRGEGSAPITERPPLIINDIKLDPRFEGFRIIAEKENIRAFADVPLQTRDKVIGTLSVYYGDPHLFTVAELDLLTTFANQAAAAVSNATLYAQTDKALSYRVEELAALEKIGRELTSTLDFNRVITRVLDAAIQSTNTTYGLVALYDADKHTLNMVAAHGYPPQVLASASIENWPTHQDVIGSAIRDRKAVWLTDVRKDNSFKALDSNTRSMLVAPIIQDGKPLGVINLESTQLEAFDENSAAFVGQLTIQAAIAMQNAQLYQQAHHRLREVRTLFDMGRKFTSILDLPELGQELTRQLASALGTSHCMLELIARDSDLFEVIAEYADPKSKALVRIHEQSNSAQLQSITGLRRNPEPVILYADSTVASHELDFLKSNQLYAMLALPLVSGDKLIGRIIWFHDQARSSFSPDEIRFAETLTNQASIAVENAQLFRERARRANDLSRLQEAGLALAATVELDKVLDNIARIARELTDSDAATLYLYNANIDRVTRSSQSAKSDFRLTPDISSIRPDGMTRRVIAQRQPILINDVTNDPRIHPNVLKAGVRSMIALPIMRKNQVVGVLYVNSRTPAKYTEDNLQLAQLLTNQAAIAIENARLFSEIAETSDRLAAILNSSELGVLMFDVSGRVIVANPVLEQLWGIHHYDLEGKLLIELIDVVDLNLPARLGYSADALRTLVNQATTDVRMHWGKDTITLPGSRARTVERTGSAVLDESGGLLGWTLVLRDVTEEHELQQMRDDLSNMIVHDLRSPLVAILDSYELITEEIKPQGHTTVASQALEVGRRSSAKLLDLVNSLLDISRFEDGKMPLDTQFATLHPLLEGVLERLAPSANDQGVIIRNEVPSDLPLLKIDEDKITRVLINLIDNAVKFSPVGGKVSITAWSKPKADDEETQFIICSVHDTGPGIPVEYRERIFNRFMQFGEGRMQRRGTGLGLAFCKLSVEAHAGTIWVEDIPEGEGSRFSFTLPIGKLLPP